MAKSNSKQLVVCIGNEGIQHRWKIRKIYVVVPDAAAEKESLLRIIDESGEDYLYPKSFFRIIELPAALKRAVLAAA